MQNRASNGRFGSHWHEPDTTMLLVLLAVTQERGGRP